MTDISNVDPFSRPTPCLEIQARHLTINEICLLVILQPSVVCHFSSFCLWIQSPPSLPLAYTPFYIHALNSRSENFYIGGIKSLRRSLAILPGLAQDLFSFDSFAQPVPLRDHRHNEKGIIFLFTKCRQDHTPEAEKQHSCEFLREKQIVEIFFPSAVLYNSLTQQILKLRKQGFTAKCFSILHLNKTIYRVLHLPPSMLHLAYIFLSPK